MKSSYATVRETIGVFTFNLHSYKTFREMTTPAVQTVLLDVGPALLFLVKGSARTIRGRHHPSGS